MTPKIAGFKKQSVDVLGPKGLWSPGIGDFLDL